MLNQVVLVGRVTSIEEISKEENKICNITLAVQRSYKNVDGEYETDFILCSVWRGIAENVLEYCKKGDLIGIRGRLQSNENGFELIAEKVTFLSTNKDLINRED